MTAEEWRRVEQLYFEALERPAGERDAFLNRAAGGDETLLRRVADLLKSHDEAGGFLDKQAIEAAARAAAEEYRKGSDASTTASRPLVGQTLGHFKVISLLGAGGMGEVYLGHDNRLERTVALKVLPSHLATDRDHIRRLTREAKAASALNHPNVATIYEIGESDGLSFISMEYVQGQTLAQRIGGRPIDLPELVKIAKELADVLDAAHSKGITHRDIKPSNLMLTERGQLKVLDFGLVKLIHPQEQVTRSAADTASRTLPGVIMGTAAYMSPEQAQGLDVDSRSDLFSFGVVLYEMSTGRSPFQGANSTDTIGRILHVQPEPVTRLNSRVPAELQRIIAKCLEKDANNRYQSAREVLVDLETVQLDNGSIVTGATHAVTLHSNPPSLLKRSWTPVWIVLILTVMGSALFMRYRTSINQPINRIVVLPFVSLGSDPDSEALCDGVWDSVVNSLSRVRTLNVVAKTTSRSYKGRSANDVSRMGRELEAQAVVVGQCSPQADSLNIQVDLMDVDGNRNLWGDHYPAKLADIFSVQDSIASQIADRLRHQLSGEEQQQLTSHGTKDPEAYRLYVLARHHALKSTQDSFEKALEFYDRAIKRDPNYALAYAGKAEAYMMASDLFLPSVKAGQQAQIMASAAMERDNELSEAHCVLGIVRGMYQWDWAGAEREFDSAQRLDPASECVHDSYGMFLALVRPDEKALAKLRDALRLDPRSPLRRNSLGYGLYLTKRYDEAAIELRTALDLDPSYWGASLWLGEIYIQTGKFEQALAEFKKLPPAEFRDAPAYVAVGLAKAGRKDEALKVLQQLSTDLEEAEKSNRRATSAWAFATLYTALGDKDKAFEWLYRARDEHFVLIGGLAVDPIYESLRNDIRYKALLRDIGLEH